MSLDTLRTATVTVLDARPPSMINCQLFKFAGTHLQFIRVILVLEDVEPRKQQMALVSAGLQPEGIECNLRRSFNHHHHFNGISASLRTEGPFRGH